jgi:hypothetical protein
MRRLALALMGEHRETANGYGALAELNVIAARQPAAAEMHAGDSHSNKWNRPPLQSQCGYERLSLKSKSSSRSSSEPCRPPVLAVSVRPMAARGSLRT